MFNVDFGARQGSVLSPYLFAIYVDDLAKLCQYKRGVYIILYADDILLNVDSLSYNRKQSGTFVVHGVVVGSWLKYEGSPRVTGIRPFPLDNSPRTFPLDIYPPGQFPHIVVTSDNSPDNFPFILFNDV